MNDTAVVTPTEVAVAGGRDPDTYLGTGGWAEASWLSIHQKLVRWSYFTILRQRNISWVELREELGGISHQRLGQILNRLDEPRYQDRIDAAVTAITEGRHKAAGHRDEDPSCAVYTACGLDHRLRKAKMGVMREWRSEAEG